MKTTGSAVASVIYSEKFKINKPKVHINSRWANIALQLPESDKSTSENTCSQLSSSGC